jgi:hypothetical protein
VAVLFYLQFSVLIYLGEDGRSSVGPFIPSARA